jgi:hypothetical protein
MAHPEINSKFGRAITDGSDRGQRRSISAESISLFDRKDNSFNIKQQRRKYDYADGKW